MVSSITPTMISKLVPPKKLETMKSIRNLLVSNMGKTAIQVRKKAPAKVRRVIVRVNPPLNSRYVAPVTLEVIRDLDGVELGGYLEI